MCSWWNIKSYLFQTIYFLNSIFKMVFNIASAAYMWLLAMMIKVENTIGLGSFQIIYFLSSIFKIVFNVASAASKHARTYARYTQIKHTREYICILTILDSMSRLWSRLLFPRTGVQRNISIELPSLLRLSKLLTATIPAASYNSRNGFGLVFDVNSAVDGLLTMWKCSVLVANVQISDSAITLCKFV